MRLADAGHPLLGMCGRPKRPRPRQEHQREAPAGQGPREGQGNAGSRRRAGVLRSGPGRSATCVPAFDISPPASVSDSPATGWPRPQQPGQRLDHTRVPHRCGRTARSARSGQRHPKHSRRARSAEVCAHSAGAFADAPSSTCWCRGSKRSSRSIASRPCGARWRELRRSWCLTAASVCPGRRRPAGLAGVTFVSRLGSGSTAGGEEAGNDFASGRHRGAGRR